MSPISQHVGGFELLARLGRGGQGESFLARPWDPHPARRRFARLVVLALARAGLLGERATRRLRLASVKVAHPAAADSLHDEHGHLAGPGPGHPHLVALYSRRWPGRARDFGLLPGSEGARPYLALAYLPGCSLAELLRQRDPLPPSWSVAVVAQLAAALAYLHRRGVVHHDVRAANVVVRGPPPQRPHATLIDLGAAETPAAPRRRAIYGVVAHLPPERTAAFPAPASPLVDLYGLGVLLRELTINTCPSPGLTRLVGEATLADPERRQGALPSVEALLERLASLPETPPWQACESL